MADSKNPTPGEITILAAGAVALIFSFFDFYKSASISVGNATYGGGGISVWSSGLFPVATLMVIFVVIMAVVVALTRFGNVALPDPPFALSWNQIHLMLGFFAALYALTWLIKSKGGVDFGIGFWFILIACIAALVGAVLLQREVASAPPSA
ncbi:MAG TPA: hypothetical protein VGA62_00065 [Acidimicrobiia bacterium]